MILSVISVADVQQQLMLNEIYKLPFENDSSMMTEVAKGRRLFSCQGGLLESYKPA